MRAVVNGISQEELAERHARGLDHLDEMWEGLLHMAPAPANEHQAMVTDLCGVLQPYVTRHGLGRIIANCNVRNPDSSKSDYRVPDLVFVRADRESIIGATYIEGGPDLVIEVLSPDDETYDKMPFYERIGTRWLMILPADGSRIELFRLVGARFIQQAPNEAGWFRCDPLEASWRTTGRPRGLTVRLERESREESVP